MMMTALCNLTLWIVVVLFREGSTARILVMPAPDGGSHVQSMSNFFTRLAANGHDVHVLDLGLKEPKTRYANVSMHNVFAGSPFDRELFGNFVWKGRVTSIFFQQMHVFFHQLVINVLDKKSDEFERLAYQHWDLVVADDIFSPHAWAVCLKLKKRGVPFVIYSTAGQIAATTAENLGLSRNPVSNPFMFPRLPPTSEHHFNPLDFWHRVEAFTDVATEVFGFNTFVQNSFLSMKRFGVHDFSWSELFKQADVVFSESVDRLGWPQAEATNVINIGASCKPAEELVDVNLRSFVEDPTSNGTIYIAFGNHVDWTFAPRHVLKAFSEAMERLKEYRIVLSYRADKKALPSLPHVRYLKWAPQQALLSHWKTKLFISHVGLKSLKEAICTQTPFVMMPLHAEQPHNAHMGLALNWGGYLNKHSINADQIYSEAIKVISEPHYVAQVRRLRAVMLDRPVAALDLASFQVDRVLRARGGRVNFRRKAVDLYWFQFLYLDALVVLLLFVYSSLYCLRLIRESGDLFP